MATIAAVELPIEGWLPVAEITTGGRERLQVDSSSVANQTGVPATTTPRSSFQAIEVPSGENETPPALPWIGSQQSLPSVGKAAPRPANGTIAIRSTPAARSDDRGDRAARRDVDPIGFRGAEPGGEFFRVGRLAGRVLDGDGCCR